MADPKSLCHARTHVCAQMASVLMVMDVSILHAVFFVSFQTFGEVTFGWVATVATVAAWLGGWVGGFVGDS